MDALDLPQGSKLVVLVLCNGIPGAMMVDLLGEIKESSKNIGTHKRRELFWQALTKLGNLATSQLEEKIHGFMTFHLVANEEDADKGAANIIQATKRQRGLLGSVEIFGKKFKSEDPDESSDGWFSCWFDEAAQVAYDDIMHGEPVVYLSQDMDGVFVGTKLKRRKCRSAPSKPLQNSADVEAFKETLLPDNPLQSISWAGNQPPKINDYNFVLAGKMAKAIVEDKSIAQVPNASPDEIYACFENNRNNFFIAEGDKMIGVMLADIGKGEANPLCNTTMKLAGVARQNGLLKKVIVHGSKKKFINAVIDDAAGVEMFVVREAPEDSQFMQYGGVVFELHYRADLSIFSF